MDLKSFFEEQDRLAMSFPDAMIEADFEHRYPLSEDDPILAPYFKARAACVELLKELDSQGTELVDKIKWKIVYWDLTTGIAIGKPREEIDLILRSAPGSTSNSKSYPFSAPYPPEDGSHKRSTLRK